jgi:hypothetical protein
MIYPLCHWLVGSLIDKQRAPLGAFCVKMGVWTSWGEIRAPGLDRRAGCVIMEIVVSENIRLVRRLAIGVVP